MDLIVTLCFLFLWATIASSLTVLNSHSEQTKRRRRRIDSVGWRRRRWFLKAWRKWIFKLLEYSRQFFMLLHVQSDIRSKIFFSFFLAYSINLHVSDLDTIYSYVQAYFIIYPIETYCHIHLALNGRVGADRACVRPWLTRFVRQLVTPEGVVVAGWVRTDGATESRTTN